VLWVVKKKPAKCEKRMICGSNDSRQRERAKKGGNIGHKRKARGTRQVQKGIRKTSQQTSGHSSESGKQAGKGKLGGREGGGGMSGSTVLGRLEDDRHSATQTRVGDKRCLGPNHRNDRRTDGAKLQSRKESITHRRSRGQSRSSEGISQIAITSGQET
jgi:hypothetical protein